MTGQPRTATQIADRVAAWVNERESWLVVAAVPPLLLSEYLAPLLPLSVVILFTVLVCRIIRRLPVRLGIALDVPLFIIMVMLIVSVSISSDPGLSMPKLTTIVAALALFWSLATNLRTWNTIRVSGIVLALSSLGVVGVALVGTEWPPNKVFYLAWFYDILPALISGMPRSIRGGFHPNEVGGALAMLLPVVLATVIIVWTRAAPMAGEDLLPSIVRRRAPTMLTGRGLLLIMLALSLLLALFVFVLTQSRGALVGLLAGFAILLLLRDWRLSLVILLLAAVLLGVAIVYNYGLLKPGLTSVTERSDQTQHDRLASLLEAANRISRLGSGATSTATGRAEMWRNAVQAISDYPLTGIGLYTFPAVSWANYVYNVVSPLFQMNHAHNTYLETGVDFGVPGLAAFLLVVGIILIKGVRLALQGATPDVRWLACGLVGGLSANLVHGLMDSALPLGHKPGIIWWAMAGLLVAADRLRPDTRPASLPARRLARAVALGCLIVALWALMWGPLRPVMQLNLGAVALDQARLRTDLTAAERTARLDRAEALLTKALPWKADTVNLRLGLVEDARGRVEAARAYWSQTPLALPYLVAQGDRWEILGAPSRAERWFQHAVAVDPSSSSAWYRIGLVAANRERTSEAQSALQKALDLDNYLDRATERGATYAALASIMGRQGRWSEAVELYRQAEAISSRFIFQADVAWALYQRDGNVAAAEAYLRSSIQKTPHQVEPYVALVDLLHADDRDDEALQIGEQTALRFPEEVTPLLAMGRIYMAQNADDKAEDMFRRAVALRPTLPEPREWLGRLALRQQRAREAIAAFCEAIRLAPERAEYYVLLGEAYQLAGDYVNAAAAYAKALEYDPQNEAAQQGLAGLSE